MDKNSTQISSSYQIKPPVEEKFKNEKVKEIVRNILAETLASKNYDNEDAKSLTVTIATDINKSLKDLNLNRYKHIIQVNIGERKGQGVKSGVMCLWDSETDTFVSETYLNDSLFCVATVFGVYLY